MGYLKYDKTSFDEEQVKAINEIIENERKEAQKEILLNIEKNYYLRESNKDFGLYLKKLKESIK